MAAKKTRLRMSEEEQLVELAKQQVGEAKTKDSLTIKKVKESQKNSEMLIMRKERAHSLDLSNDAIPTDTVTPGVGTNLSKLTKAVSQESWLAKLDAKSHAAAFAKIKIDGGSIPEKYQLFSDVSLATPLELVEYLSQYNLTASKVRGMKANGVNVFKEIVVEIWEFLIGLLKDWEFKGQVRSWAYMKLVMIAKVAMRGNC